MRVSRCLHSELISVGISVKTLSIPTSTKPNRVLHQSALDFRVEGGHTLIVERYLAADKDIEYDTKAPHVNFGSSVHFRVEKLRGGKIKGSAECGEVLDRVI